MSGFSPRRLTPYAFNTGDGLETREVDIGYRHDDGGAYLVPVMSVCDC